MKRLLALFVIAVCAVAVAGLSLAGTTRQGTAAPEMSPAPSAEADSTAKMRTKATAHQKATARAKAQARAQARAKARARARAATSDGSGVVSSPPQPASDPASYWTAQRQEDAQPMEKTLPGGDGTGAKASGQGTTPAGGTASGSAKKKTASGDVQGSTGSATEGDPADYWTADAQESATPMEKTAPGGNGSGQSGGSGSGTAPAGP